MVPTGLAKTTAVILPFGSIAALELAIERSPASVFDERHSPALSSKRGDGVGSPIRSIGGRGYPAGGSKSCDFHSVWVWHS
jgi:hypothetical protein